MHRHLVLEADRVEVVLGQVGSLLTLLVDRADNHGLALKVDVVIRLHILTVELDRLIDLHEVGATDHVHGNHMRATVSVGMLHTAAGSSHGRLRQATEALALMTTAKVLALRVTPQVEVLVEVDHVVHVRLDAHLLSIVHRDLRLATGLLRGERQVH